MIRLLYWILAIIEVLLILFVVVLFIITDARTVKMIADQSLSSTKFTYKSIEGNFITGLEVKELAYDERALFESATLHWNPITLMYQKITLTEFDVKGVDVDNIISMVNELDGNDSSNGGSFMFALSFERIHLDIKPYVYEGVTFDSFLFETEKIEIDTDLQIDANNLYLYFDSTLVNVELMGQIEKSRLLLDKANLKEIDSRAIALFNRTMRTKTKSIQSEDDNRTNVVKDESSKEESEPILKEIKIEHIFATMKDVTYKPLDIKDVKLLIDNAEFDTYNNYSYKAKQLHFTGSTNFGNVDYKGSIKDSTISAKGRLLLDKELFTRYHLPLNYQNLRKLPGTLRLNHQGVWIDIDHNVKKLLKLKSDFNLDVTRAKHKLHYDYSDGNLTIKSKMKVNMPYGDDAILTNLLEVDVNKKGYTTYSGDVKIPKVKNLPIEVSDYLLEDLTAKFKGDKSELFVKLDSKLITGEFVTHDYKNAILKLKSKERDIALNKMISGLPSELESEVAALESETSLDLKNLENSKINLKIDSNIININGDMKLIKPYKILFTGVVASNSTLSKIDKSINLNNIKNISGDLLIRDDLYMVTIKNEDELTILLNYNGKTKLIKEGKLSLGSEEVTFSSLSSDEIEFKSKIKNIKDLSLGIEKYYDIKLPKIEGNINLNIIQHKSGLLKFALKSPKLTYVDGSKVDIENIDIKFTLDSNGDIVIERYRFKLDNNPYFRDFYADKNSYLNFKDNKLTVKKLWLNNQALAKGSYDLETSNGDFELTSKKFPFISRDFDLLFNFDVDVKIREKLIEVDGDVDILGNSVHYDLAGSNIVEDADIIVVQEQLKEQESALQNLKLYLKVKSIKPLKYYGSDTNIEFYNELRVIKEYKADLMVTGMLTITKGYYQMEDKRFILNESHLYFAGDPKKPLLDIKANYEKDQYLIHIFISGSTEEPIVNFNSEPYLTQQEILSLILFDGTGSSSGQGADAYTVLGGTFAKGLIKSLGIDVDHLLLGTDSNDELSLEVGRKVSKNITIMYMHEDGKDGAKVRIEHSKNFETDIIIQPPSSSSIEFLYKQNR